MLALEDCFWKIENFEFNSWKFDVVVEAEFQRSRNLVKCGKGIH